MTKYILVSEFGSDTSVFDSTVGAVVYSGNNVTECCDWLVNKFGVDDCVHRIRNMVARYEAGAIDCGMLVSNLEIILGWQYASTASYFEAYKWHNRYAK